MGKGPQYIALSCSVSSKLLLIAFLFLALALCPQSRLAAQVIITHGTPIGITAHPVDSNTITLIDTTKQALVTTDSLLTDTSHHLPLAKAPLHSARKAAYLLAVLPGLGQAYNKKYWKIPIIYAGFGGLGYALYYTASNFNGYRGAYRQQVALVPNYNASYNGVSDAATLKVYRDYFKKYVDISSIGIGVWYLLNIIDATVDAHLMGWNMKDDLSISWNPTVIASPNYNTAAAGATITLHF